MLLLSLSLPGLSFLHRRAVCQQIELLFMLCEHLQQVAMLTNQQQEVHFDTAQHTYAHDVRVQQLPAHVHFGVPNGLQGPPAAPRAPVRSPVTFPRKLLVFHPDGTMQAGTVYLTDSKRECAYALTVPVSAVSYLRLYRYDNGWQLIE